MNGILVHSLLTLYRVIKAFIAKVYELAPIYCNFSEFLLTFKKLF